MSHSLVSICIPVFNGERFLEEALQSIEVQDYPNIEVIISDDGSTDSSLSICKKFKNTSIFPVSIYEHTASGIGANWNYCLSKANGSNIKFLFQDDILFPGCVGEMVVAIEKSEEIRLVAGKREILYNPNIEWQKKWKDRYGDLQSGLTGSDKKDFVLDKSFLRDQNFFRDPYNRIGEPTAVLFDKALIEEIGGFRTDLKIVLDIEFYYRVLTKYKIMILDKELVGFRLHDYQASRLEIGAHKREFELYQKILYKDYRTFLSRTHRWKLIKRRIKKFFSATKETSIKN